MTLLVNGVFTSPRMSEPIGICSIAASMRVRGIEVQLFDPRLEGFSPSQAAGAAHTAHAEIIGISAFSFEIDEISEFSREVRRRGFRGPIVLGGLGPTLVPDLYLSSIPECDYVARGEGETTMPEIVEAFARAGRRGIDSLSCGVTRRNGNSIVESRVADPIENLDDLPFMARDVLERNIEKFGADQTTASIIAGRGCFGTCSFCWISSMLDLQPGRRYRQRSVPNVVDEIQYIVERYGVTDFAFEDDNFVAPGAAGAKRSSEFRQELERRDLQISFFFQTRPDTITNSVIENYAAVGLKKVFIGIETIVSDDARLYSKQSRAGSHEQDVTTALRILRTHGYVPEVDRENRGRVRVGYIAFHHLTTLADLSSSVDFFRRYNLTPKRLMTTVRYYPGEMAIRNAIADKVQDCKSDVETSFKDPKVAAVYNALWKYAKPVLATRERIRGVEKLAIRQGISKQALDGIDKDRRWIDAHILSAMDVFVSVAQAAPSSQAEKVVENQRSRFSAEVDRYIDEFRVTERVTDLESKYAVQPRMSDVYW